MKKLTVFVLVLICILSLIACGNRTPEDTKTIQTDFRTYTKMSDGTWGCDGHTYKHRLEINGRMPNAAVDTTFVYLSNIETITFEQAYKAAGYSSNSEDYFSIEEAILVDWTTD